MGLLLFRYSQVPRRYETFVYSKSGLTLTKLYRPPTDPSQSPSRPSFLFSSRSFQVFSCEKAPRRRNLNCCYYCRCLFPRPSLTTHPRHQFRHIYSHSEVPITWLVATFNAQFWAEPIQRSQVAINQGQTKLAIIAYICVCIGSCIAVQLVSGQIRVMTG